MRPENSPYWSRFVSSLLPYIPGEQPKEGKFIKLNTNENPYPPSPRVIDALQRAADDRLRLYPEPSSSVMREAVAARWRVKPEQVFCGNGSDEILAFAFAAFFEARDSSSNNRVEPLLFPRVSYSFYPVYAALWNRPCKAIPLDRDFFIDPEDYKRVCGGVIMPNPNAPTGRALDREALAGIARAQEQNRKIFIIDEAYIAFASGSNIGSMIPFIDDHPNLLVIRTLSKEASLAGLRSGFAVGSEELVEGLCRVRDSFNSYTMDRLAQAASAAAISDALYYDEINRRVCHTRDRTAGSLSYLGFRVIPSQANFIFVSPPAPRNGALLNTGRFCASLRERGILVRHFRQPEIEKYLRVSIGTDEDMDRFLDACKDIIRNEI